LYDFPLNHERKREIFDAGLFLPKLVNDKNQIPSFLFFFFVAWGKKGDAEPKEALILILSL